MFASLKLAEPEDLVVSLLSGNTRRTHEFTRFTAYRVP